MKKIIIGIFSFLFTLNSLWAECSDWATSFFPSGRVLSPNGLVIFEGYQNATEIIKGLNKKYPIYLQSGKHKVLLEIQEINEGYGTLQAVLKPKETLKEGNEYELIVENYKPSEEHHTILRYNTQANQYEKPVWKIEKFNKEKLDWIRKPIDGKKYYEELGCGPSISVEFTFEIEAENPYFIRATLINSKTKQKKSYWLEINKQNRISVGHSMCSGEFSFGEEKYYEIKFDIIDLVGNTNQWTSDGIVFTKPTPRR